MPRIYFYKLTGDDGGAPCMHDGLLSLAICKPVIRRTAQQGDVIIGFAANSLNKDNHLIYIARVTTKLCNGDYYKDALYCQRGDCIYTFQGDCFVWKPGALHHGPGDLPHDIGLHPDYARANILLSTDFRYFGGAGSDEYKYRYPLVCEAVSCLGRGHRVEHTAHLRDELLRMIDWVWQTAQTRRSGHLANTSRRCTCQRAVSRARAARRCM